MTPWSMKATPLSFLLEKYQTIYVSKLSRGSATAQRGPHIRGTHPYSDRLSHRYDDVLSSNDEEHIYSLQHHIQGRRNSNSLDAVGIRFVDQLTNWIIVKFFFCLLTCLKEFLFFKQLTQITSLSQFDIFLSVRLFFILIFCFFFYSSLNGCHGKATFIPMVYSSLRQ